MRDGTRTLWCFVYGDLTHFQVNTPPNADVYDLKALILKERANVLQGYDAADLVLRKVRMPQNTIIASDTNAEQHEQPSKPIFINPPCDLVNRTEPFRTEFADEMESSDCVSVFFPQQPNKDHLHILVGRHPGRP
jgi:hypothetical protein